MRPAWNARKGATRQGQLAGTASLVPAFEWPGGFSLPEWRKMCNQRQRACLFVPLLLSTDIRTFSCLNMHASPSLAAGA